MEQKDHLMRMIEKIGRILGKVCVDVLRLNSIGKFEESIGEIKLAVKNEIDLDLDEILALGESQLADFLKQKSFNAANTEMLAALLAAIGQGYSDKGDSQTAGPYLARAMWFYEHLNRTGKTFSAERQNKLLQLKKMLNIV